MLFQWILQERELKYNNQLFNTSKRCRMLQLPLSYLLTKAGQKRIIEKRDVTRSNVLLRQLFPKVFQLGLHQPFYMINNPDCTIQEAQGLLMVGS